MSQSASVPRSRETSLVLSAGAILAMGLGVALHGGTPKRSDAPAATRPQAASIGVPISAAKPTGPQAPATVASAVAASLSATPAGASPSPLQTEPSTGTLPHALVQPDPLAPASAAVRLPAVKRVTTASITAAPVQAGTDQQEAADWITLTVPHDVPTLDGATFIIDTTTYRLAGVEPVPGDEICATKAGVPWACGSRARVALRLAIVDQTLRCRAQSTSASEITTVACLKDGKPVTVGRIEP